jgi:hypothetical protein
MRVARYRLTPNGKKSKKRGDAKYQASAKGKESLRRYRTSLKGKENARRRQEVFWASLNGQLLKAKRIIAFPLGLKAKDIPVELAELKLVIKQARQITKGKTHATAKGSSSEPDRAPDHALRDDRGGAER